MRVCLIFNPQAGSAERVKDFIFRLPPEHRCEVRPCAAGCDPADIAREIADESFDRLVVAGGDGTVSRVVNGLAPEFAIEVAILPFGTGNDLARSLGLVAEDIHKACDAAFGSQVVEIDVVQVTVGDKVTHCINVANGGMGGRVAIDVAGEDKQRWGPLAYWMTSISQLVNLTQYKVRVDLDHQTVEREAYGIAVANGRFVGGGFPMAPRAAVNDGLLDITLVPVLPMLELMAAGLNFTLGREQQADRVEHYQARHVEVRSNPPLPFSIDGETTESVDAVFEIIPRALRVVVGDNPVGIDADRV